jgi:hypothetical protein
LIRLQLKNSAAEAADGAEAAVVDGAEATGQAVLV